MRPVTLVYCINDDKVLFAVKKRGFGEGKLNGYGGKVMSGESIEQAAARELFEENTLRCSTDDLVKVAQIDFYFPEVPKEKDWDQTMHVYLLRKWKGTPRETEEMRPEWHKLGSIPVERMWSGDRYWLPRVLKGQKVRASVTFVGKGESVASYELEELGSKAF